MLKKLLTIVAMLLATAAFAAVDVNTANEAELDSVRGIGPGLSGKILAERKQGEFKDWNDLISRVRGVGSQSAARLSQEGLTVGGKKYGAAATSRAESRSTKHGDTATHPKDGADTPADTPADAAGAAAGPLTEPASPGSAGASKN